MGRALLYFLLTLTLRTMVLQHPRLKGTISKPTVLESWKRAKYSASWCRCPHDLYRHHKRLQDRQGRWPDHWITLSCGRLDLACAAQVRLTFCPVFNYYMHCTLIHVYIGSPIYTSVGEKFWLSSFVRRELQQFSVTFLCLPFISEPLWWRL